MPDLTVYNLSFMLQACRDKDYRERTRTTARTLVHFLESNGLLSKRVRRSVKLVPDDLLIRESPDR
jgi:hypothetical protein